MSKEQAKEFFEAISKDKQLAEEVKEVIGGQATNQQKAKEVLSLAKAYNFNFTEDEMKTSLSREDLADIAGGSGLGQAMAGLALSTMQVLGVGGNGGQQPLTELNQIINVQQVGNGNALNQGENQDGNENEAPPAAADEANEVDEIRELTPEEIAERQQREEQRQRELEERLAQGPLELAESEPNWFENEETNRLFREIDDTELMTRVNQLNTLYYRLLYVPQSQELMDRIRNYIATVGGFTFDRGTVSLQEQISIADALIHEAEEMRQRAEQKREIEIREEELRAEIQHDLDTLALILQRTHTGLLYTDVKTFLANRESYTREERIARANALLDQTQYFLCRSFYVSDRLYLDDGFSRLSPVVCSWDGDEQAILEERLENNAFPWLGSVCRYSFAPGELELAFEVQEFLATINGDFTDEHLAEMNSLLDRAREIMMNRARAYNRFDIDRLHIRNNDLQLAQMLGIDGEYVKEKIKNKIKMSENDITGTIALPDGDTVTFNFMVGSGTLVLTGSENTKIGSRFEFDSLWKQLEEAGIVFEARDAKDWRTDEQLPTRDDPFFVRNLIIGNGITAIGEGAFRGATALGSVYFMGPVRLVDYDAFNYSFHLVEVGFAQPETVEFIGGKAFGDNWTLRSINIPQSANIDETAFFSCDKLKDQGCPYCVKPK